MRRLVFGLLLFWAVVVVFGIVTVPGLADTPRNIATAWQSPTADTPAVVPAAISFTPAYTVYAPVVWRYQATPPSGDAIVIDHNCTDLSQIPDTWLEEAKKLTFHYAHTSHGSQIIEGINKLEQVDSRYSVAIQTGGSPPTLPGEAGALQMYDGNSYWGDTYITPDMYWEEQGGRDHTRSVADTGLFDYSMWAWCGQMSEYDDGTVNLYLSTLNQFETDYPDMRFIYMTGHTDDGSPVNVTYNNDLVRDYVNANDKVLFDFADIEKYDPAGNYYTNADDSCPWCGDWCSAHPLDCTDLPGYCSHSHPLMCKLKGNAFWWMMARLAGWPGP